MKSFCKALALIFPLLGSSPAADAAGPPLRRAAPASTVLRMLPPAADGARGLAVSRQPLGPLTAEAIPLGTTPGIDLFSELRESVALLVDGSYATAWTDWDGPRFDVRMQWVKPDGSPLFPSGGVLVAEADNPFEAAVIANPAGGAFVAYARGVKDPEILHLDTDFRQVFIQSYDAAGQPVWPEGGLYAMNVDPSNFQDQLHMAPAPGGGVYVCASESHAFVSDGNLSDIRCQRLGAGGERLWSDQGIIAGGMPGWKVIPKLVSDGRDGVMVFWSNKRDAFSHPKDHTLIEGQHFTSSGVKAWGPRGRILRTTGIGASASATSDELGAVPDGQGGAVLSFDDWSGRGALLLDVYAQRVNGAGRVLWRAGTAVATGDTQQQNDSITAAPDGGAFVTVWVPNIASDPAPDRLWLYRLGPDGRTLWKRQLASPEDGDAIASDWGAYGSFDGGRLRIAWNHQRQQGSGTAEPRLALFDLAGHLLNGPSGTPIREGAGFSVLRGLAFDPSRGQGFAVWLEANGQQVDVAGGFFRDTE